ncbi:YhcN/YlaJ family sporulation lipoprotein [Paenibacillus sp. GYB003]|uniref:YhcN/YlaJ family sporulation lipoprotein n=1 Tax=Paenibacillus sp. GYB003 TaxID=2994392 RepID=UPI002F96CE66
MKRQSIAAIATVLVTASMFAAGCANNANNGQMRQQGTQMQQNQNQQNQNQQNQNQQNQNQQNQNQQNQNQQNQNQQAQPLGNMDNRIQIANQAAQKIADIDGVNQANVLVTNRNAYVAASMDTNQQLTSEIEKRIADQVRADDPNIQNVYVSTNPQFVDRVNSYVTEAGQGRPVAGFFDQFNEMTQKLFPNAR